MTIEQENSRILMILKQNGHEMNTLDRYDPFVRRLSVS